MMAGVDLVGCREILIGRLESAGDDAMQQPEVPRAPRMPTSDGVPLTPEQKEIVAVVVKKRRSVFLTGTGKRFLVGHLVDALVAKHGPDAVFATAPTATAARTLPGGMPLASFRGYGRDVAVQRRRGSANDDGHHLGLCRGFCTMEDDCGVIHRRDLNGVRTRLRAAAFNCRAAPPAPGCLLRGHSTHHFWRLLPIASAVQGDDFVGLRSTVLGGGAGGGCSISN